MAYGILLYMKRLSTKAQKSLKNTTMDELAGMVASGFSEMGERIEELDERFSGQMKILDQKITAVNTNVLSLQYDYKKIVSRLENLELNAFGSVQE